MPTIPDGAIVWRAERPYLVGEDALLPWTPSGYEPPQVQPGADLVTVLTPRSTVAALAQGYAPELHQTASV